MIEGPFAWAKAAVKNNEDLKECTEDWTASMGMPCQHDCISFVRTHRTHPFGRDEFSSHWLLWQEEELIQDALRLGSYIPRIDPTSVQQEIDRMRGEVVPHLHNPYVGTDPTQPTYQRFQNQTILDPVRQQHVGRRNEAFVSQRATGGVNTAEVLSGQSQPAPSIRPTEASGRASSGFEIVERETAPKAPTIRCCGACGKPGHNRNSKDCQYAADIAVSDVNFAASQRPPRPQPKRRRLNPNNTVASTSVSVSQASIQVSNSFVDLPGEDTLAPGSQPSDRG